MINKKLMKYSAEYFKKTTEIIKREKPKNTVVLQFFQRKKDVVLCGINEVIDLLLENTNYKKYNIKYLPEGTIIQPGEVVLELEGKYEEFGLLEGIIDGILARQSSIATNASNIIAASGNKGVIFMGDRSDHYRNQSSDGYAVSLGGIQTQVTKEQVKFHSGKAIGTMPHALIQMYDGDLVEATKAFQKIFPKTDIIALVDFNNDVINDSIKLLDEFGSFISGVRVDTAENMSDKYFEDMEQEFGVTPNLIKALRRELDNRGGSGIKIIVSSGLTEEKIRNFEKEATPIDFYGVGSYILKINLSFTADAVKLNDKEVAKKGRQYKDTKKLIKI